MSEHDETSSTTAADAPAKKATKKAAAKKATKKVAAKKTAAKEPAAKEPAAKEPAAKKSAAKKATKKSAAKKTTATADSADAPAKKPAKRAATKRTAAKAASSADDASGSASEDAAAPATSADADAGSGSGEERPRTRTRSRARRSGASAAGEGDAAPARSGAAAAAKDDGGPDDAADGADGKDGADGEPGRRRRRRGGRGRRGRGRSGGAAAEGSAEDGDAPESAEGDAADGASGERPARKRAKARSGADGDQPKDDEVRGGRAKKAKKAKKSAKKDGDDGDRLPRGGTRMAAKQARRSGGQGATRGGGGGGQRRPARHGGVTDEERRAILAGPPRTMLVTAKPERTQIAVMEERTLVEHYVTRDEDVTFVGNIYMGRVQNVLPGMEAAFIDIGKGRNGVLYAGEVLYDEHDLEEESDQRIENVLKPGQKVLVQVTKDPMGTKGPRLTMHLSLAGRYVVLAPESDLFGISRKLTDTERDRLRRIVKAAKPEGHGVIVRTAAEGATEEALTADVERLVERWRRVEEAAAKAKPLESVYEEPKLVVKVIRDIFGQDFVRCIVDDDALYGQVREYLDEVAPELADRIELYGAPTDDERSQAAGVPSLADAEEAERVATESGTTPVVVTAAERRRDLPDLFAAFDVTDQLRQAMNRKVWLPSGGYLIIESTEAMKVIDVNTGRFTGGSDSNLEEIVLKTNLEAADEIVRQLRLRDMGGMIIIDFIDMLLRSNQEQVVRRLKRELLRDRTKTRVSDVSRLGLVQMTRKNVSQGLVESFSTKCEKCDGHGFVTNL
jgi:Rne/Rng family ribonuclease